MASEAQSRFLDTPQAAAYLGLRAPTLEHWRSSGEGPHFYKLGARVFYTREDLDAFAESRRHTSTSNRRSQAS